MNKKVVFGEGKFKVKKVGLVKFRKFVVVVKKFKKVSGVVILKKSVKKIFRKVKKLVIVVGIKKVVKSVKKVKIF